jgi:arsenite methyltransferase
MRYLPRRSHLFAGVGYHLDLAALATGERVLDLGSGSGTDVFCAAIQVGETGRVIGVDFTDEQLAKARHLADRDGFPQTELVRASIDALPFEDGSFDVVISNGVINLSPVKHQVFAEAARVLKPGGRLERAEFKVGEVRVNDYDFISERALDASSTYGVESISLAARKS